MVQAIPAGYAGVTAYLIIRGAARALEYYKKSLALRQELAVSTLCPALMRSKKV